ncbi:uncharacterized protein LOC116927973 isoform X2 [Daphnia magna]|uniref:uncharacterized protein LOC116927973 isoform X2 n=1 Tax=Daphnia magna TaxID=35525 RepID=UPI0014022D20|nr:uncharacterized protein LOC116927973 isoform X2 [Daphnia magna]
MATRKKHLENKLKISRQLPITLSETKIKFMEIKAHEMLTIEYGDPSHPTSAGYSSLVSTIDHHLISSFLLMPITQLACIGVNTIISFVDHKQLPYLLLHSGNNQPSGHWPALFFLRLRLIAVSSPHRCVFAASLSSSSPSPHRCLRLRLYRIAVFVFAFTASLSSSSPSPHRCLRLRLHRIAVFVYAFEASPSSGHLS